MTTGRITGINDPLILSNIDPQWFWDRVNIGPAEHCWPWSKGKNKRGYGSLRLPGTNKVVAAHRVALVLALDRPLGQLHALHHCDNPPCCNPLDLWEGTNAENQTDAMHKGRKTRFTRVEQARIRCDYACTGTSIRGLAAQYGSNTDTILSILHRTGTYAERVRP